jgi:hypothetical protein
MPSSLCCLVLVVLGVLPSLAGCGVPRVGPARDVSPRAASLIGAPPSVYGPDAAQVPAATMAARVRVTFETALPPEPKATLTHEAALDSVAAVIAEMVSAEGQAPSQAVVQWLCWRAGVVSRRPRVTVMTTAGVDDLDLQTADFAGKMQPSIYPEAFGLARSSSGRPAQAIVLAQRALAVDSLPKAYAPGAPITLKVKPLDAFADLALLADDDQGGVAEVPLRAAADGTFSVTQPAPQKPGRYFLEITGLDPRTLQAMPENPWRRSLFWVPVYVGVPEPVAPDEAIRAPSDVRRPTGTSPAALEPAPPGPRDAAAWGDRILDLYDEARARAGKPKLLRDGRLTAMAQVRSGVVARSGREPPPDVVLADKLAAAGLPPHEYDEHHERVDTVSDYVFLRLLLPSARRRLLGISGLVTGVGLTANPPNAKGEVDFTAVEEQVDPVARFDLGRDRPKIYAALDTYETAEGRAAYKHDDDVARVLQDFADQVCRGEKRANQMKPLVDKARGVGDKFHTWSTPTWRAGYDYTRWQDQSLLAKGREPGVTHAEVGICQGDLPGKPGGSYAVAIAYGF